MLVVEVSHDAVVAARLAQVDRGQCVQGGLTPVGGAGGAVRGVLTDGEMKRRDEEERQRRAKEKKRRDRQLVWQLPFTQTSTG